jgi:hypothetical protein
VNHNLRHGLQYSPADRRKIVTWFLDHPRYGTLSARQIAALTGNLIPHSTVANIRKRRKMAPVEEVSNLDTRPDDRLTPAQQHQRLERAYGRMQDSAAFMIGVAQEMPEARPLLQPHIDRVRQALAGLKDALARLADDAEPDDNGS